MNDTVAEFMHSPIVITILSLVILILCAMYLGLVWIVKVSMPQAARKIPAQARAVAKLAWYVHKAEFFQNQGTVVEMVTHTIPRHKIELYFRLGHPDQIRATELQRMETVRFQSLRQAIEGQFTFELAPYLRIKTEGES